MHRHRARHPRAGAGVLLFGMLVLTSAAVMLFGGTAGAEHATQYVAPTTTTTTTAPTTTTQVTVAPVVITPTTTTTTIPTAVLPEVIQKPPTKLAFTGADIVGLVVIALALIGVGFGIRMLGRRRASST